MYPETDIPTVGVPQSQLDSLKSRVPLPWDLQLAELSKRYGLNQKLANQIFDSEYLPTFEEIAARTKVPANFIASKLTEDIVNLQRQGGDATLLTKNVIIDVFERLDSGSIAKEAVVTVFEKLMRKEASTVQEAITTAGAASISDAELCKILDGIINDNIAIIKEKGMAALNPLMGQAMSVLRGKADGQKINAMLREKLKRLVG
jgi:glutamyl-tRNA(Gln) amidotransferase subunit E